jgi:hypothetical protein
MLLRKLLNVRFPTAVSSFIKTHYELLCNGELIFFDDLCRPVKIKVCLKAELKRTEVWYILKIGS